MSGWQGVASQDGWPPERVRADPTGFLGARRTEQRALALALERIADRLPAVDSAAGLLSAAARLRTLALRWLPSEDRALLDPLDEATAPDCATRQVTGLVRRRGAILAGLSLELADVLERRASAAVVPESEALGYMLRDCFEAIARRADWIEAAILPQLRPLLDRDAEAELGERLAAELDSRTACERSGFAALAGGAPRRSRPVWR